MKSPVIVAALVAIGVLGLAQPASAADRQPPTIKIYTPGANAVYTLGQSVTVSYACSDNRRVVSCVGPVANLASLDTWSAVTFTFTVTATDNAGNRATKSVTYRVEGPAPPPPPPPPGNCANYYGLTFDDGPNPTYTPQVLAVLKQKGVPATFFEIGVNISAHPELTQAVAQAGYPVQNHTYSHPHLPTLSGTQISSELDQTSELIRIHAGALPTLVRPPYGDMNTAVQSVFEQLHLEDTLWTTDTNDWAGKTVSQILQAALTVPPGGIILMHDAYPNTVTALPQIIDQLRTRDSARASWSSRRRRSRPGPR